MSAISNFQLATDIRPQTKIALLKEAPSIRDQAIGRIVDTRDYRVHKPASRGV